MKTFLYQNPVLSITGLGFRFFGVSINDQATKTDMQQCFYKKFLHADKLIAYNYNDDNINRMITIKGFNMNDTQIKEYVRKLKEFYTQCFIHLIGNACAILIWGLFAGGGYWPLWVHLTSIAILIIEGYRANIIKCRCDCDWIPFLRQKLGR